MSPAQQYHNVHFSPGTLSAKVAEGIRQGKDLSTLTKELKLKNNFTFYSVRARLRNGPKVRKSIHNGASGPSPKRTGGIVKIEAIFHSAEGEAFRVLSAPKDFLSLYHTILRGKG